MTFQQNFSKRFRYPLYYIIFFTIILLICFPSGLYMIFENIQITVALVIMGISLLLMYMLYELTQTILIDQQGIAHDSLFGEIRRFSWGEIQGIKPSKNIFSPGFKVFNHNGDAIEISNSLGQYDVILELIRRAQVEFVNKPLTTLPNNADAPTSAEPAADFKFRASKYGWAGFIVFGAIGVMMFVGSLYYSYWIITLFFGVYLFVLMPYTIFDYFRKPILVATRGEYLYIKFRSKRLRKNIRVNATNVRKVCLNHRRTLTQHGAVHAETDVVIHLWKNTQVDLSTIGESHEDMYLRLCAWLEKYGNQDPQEQGGETEREQAPSY